MEFKIESGYKENFTDLLTKTCKKFKVDFTVGFSEETVIGTRVIIDNRGGCDFGGFAQTFSSKPKTQDINGYIATVIVPELARVEETGYIYLGCIKNQDDIVSIHPTGFATDDGFELSSLKEEIKDFPCVECGKKIGRKIIHVFRSPEGEVAVYGSGCAVKKFGINFTAVMDKFYNAISVLEDGYQGDDDYFGGGSFGSSIHSAQFFSFICFYHIYKNGYVSGTKAWNECSTSTKEAVLEDMALLDSDNDNATKKALVADTNKFAGETKLQWEEFKAWLPEFKLTLNDDDFGFNMTAVCDQLINGGIADRMTGYATYVVFRYWTDALAPKEPKIDYNEDYSNMNIKDKIKDLGTLTVKIIKSFARPTQYGVTNIYTFLEVNTNMKYKWFSTSVELDEDEQYEIWSGTIKEFQNDAKYGKAVILTRCKVRQVEGD